MNKNTHDSKNCNKYARENNKITKEMRNKKCEEILKTVLIGMIVYLEKPKTST